LKLVSISSAALLLATAILVADELRLEGFQVHPYYSQVSTGDTVTLTVVYCYANQEIVPVELPGDPDELAPLVNDDILEPLPTIETEITCPDDDIPIDEPVPLPILADVSAWSVNGVRGGSSRLGTIKASRRNQAVYTAPAEVPDPNTVTISAELAWGDKGKMLATAQIEIGGGGYEGTISFEDPAAGVTLGGTVRWIAIDPGADTLDGTATLDLQMSSLDNNCSLVTSSVTAAGELSLNFPEDGRYHFTLLTDAPVVSCSGMQFNIGGTWLLCTGWPESPPSMGDGSSLRGSASCDSARMEWNFRRTSAR